MISYYPPCSVISSAAVLSNLATSNLDMSTAESREMEMQNEKSPSGVSSAAVSIEDEHVVSGAAVEH